MSPELSLGCTSNRPNTADAEPRCLNHQPAVLYLVRKINAAR
jgi:hypothetical protein